MGDITKAITIWEEFLSWVETTSLFAALKNRPKGVDYYEIESPTIRMNVNISIPIIKATDLPKEVLKVFFENSPYYLSEEDKELVITTNEATIITNFINQHQHQKQLTNGN